MHAPPPDRRRTPAPTVMSQPRSGTLGTATPRPSKVRSEEAAARHRPPRTQVSVFLGGHPKPASRGHLKPASLRNSGRLTSARRRCSSGGMAPASSPPGKTLIGGDGYDILVLLQGFDAASLAAAGVDVAGDIEAIVESDGSQSDLTDC